MILDMSLIISFVLALLKLAEYIQISWLQVFLPVIITIAMITIAIVIVAVLAHYGIILKK